MNMPKTIAVIDGNSLMHRAYHAVPPTMNAPDGTPTNAVFGFLSMFLKFIDIAHPDAVVCAFDVGKPQHRIAALEQYKAQRPPMDDDLRVQFPVVEQVLAAMGIPAVKVPGWEGDDILGTIAARGDAAGYDTLLVTGDKDACQLASDHTRIVNTKRGISDVVIFDPAGVEEKYGVSPEQIPDFLGLMGDSSDNIPGVPGIGPKTAAKLLQRFGSIEGIYEHLDELKGKQQESIRDNRDAAFLSRDVAIIKCDLDFELDLENLTFPSFNEEAVTAAFEKLGMRAHLGRVLSLIGEEAPVGHVVALKWQDYTRNDEAYNLIAQVLDDSVECTGAERIGMAFTISDQENLFESGLKLAVACDTGCALIEGDRARALLGFAVGRSSSLRIAVLDAKEALQCVYPPDTAEEIHIAEADLFAMNFFDVTLAAYVLDSSVSRYDFSYLAETYLEGALAPVEDDDDRLVMQAACLRALIDPMSQALVADGTKGVYDTIDLPLVPVLAHMERIGALLDTDTLQALGSRTAQNIADISERIYELAGEKFNIDSPQQVSHILFDVIGLPPRKRTSRGYSTDAKVLEDLSSEHQLPGLILEYRELAKIMGTYIDALPKLRGADGRLHTSFNETVTTTGRLSSSNPNLQNIPVRTEFGRHIRECFIPLSPEHLFVSADYSQIELRLLAHLSGDAHLIDAFRSGADFHSATAARVFGVPVEEVTPELRSRAKAVNFGIVYGQQAFGLSQSLRIPFGEAQAMIDRYFTAYPVVRAYLDNIVAQAHEKGYALTMFGRKRHIPELRAHNAQQRAFGERTAMNHPMQGTAADIIKKAMVEVDARLRHEFPNAKMMIQVHDELDLSVPADQVGEVSALLKEVMENVVELDVPLIVDVQSAKNWAEAH